MNLWCILQKNRKRAGGWSLKPLVTATIFLFVILVQSCSYPEENKTEMMFETAEVYSFEKGTIEGTIRHYFGQDYPYQVVLAPKWIEPETLEGRTINGELVLSFRFKNVEDFLANHNSNILTGNLVVRIGKMGLFIFEFSYGKVADSDPNGTVLRCEPSELHFAGESSLFITLTNNGLYGTSWQAQAIPSWLQLSETGGYLSSGEQAIVECTVRREGLEAGDYTHQISIVTSHPEAVMRILVSMSVSTTGPPANTSTVKWIDGRVKDACLSPVGSALFVLTQNPNQLLYKLPGNDSLYAKKLSKVPNCLDVSTDGKLLAVGYNQAVVDLFDAETIELKQSFETDCVPSDIVLYENNWCYITPESDQWVYLYSLDLTTGLTLRAGNSGSVYEKTLMVKDPGGKLIYATRPSLSPGGVLVVNVAGGAAADTIPVWHEETGGKIWLAATGDKLIAANKKIYKKPEYTTTTFHTELPTKGSVTIPRSYIQSLDYCHVLESYFAVGSDYYWNPYHAETIYQVNAVSYAAVKSVKVKPYPGYLAGRHQPAMAVHHVFANKEGTKLYALKNVPYDLEMDKWALETIDLPLN